MKRLLTVWVFLLLPLCGCNEIPQHWYFAPKFIEADDEFHVACEGYITIYSPSRDVVSTSSTSQSYEIEFTDDYGKPEDLTNIKSYTIRDALSANYAMSPQANSNDTGTTYSNGTPLKPGDQVQWGNNGDAGRAIWNSPGKWSPVPCPR